MTYCLLPRERGRDKPRGASGRKRWKRRHGNGSDWRSKALGPRRLVREHEPRKGERARRAVTHARSRFGDCRFQRGKSFGGRKAHRGTRLRGREKRCEPHGRQRAATCAQGRRGGNRRGGGKPRGRNTERDGLSFPKVRQRCRAGSGLSGSYGGGASLEIPREEDPVGRSDRLNWRSRESRRQGQEGPGSGCGSVPVPVRSRSSQVIHAFQRSGGQGHGGQR